MRIIKFIFILFVLSLSFTSAFAIDVVSSIPTITALLLFVIYIIGILFLQFGLVLKNTLPLFVFWGCIFFSYLINESNEKSVNHLLAYFFMVFVLYFSIRNTAISIIQKDHRFFSLILKSLSITVFISSVYALAEFLCLNVLGININAAVPRGSVLLYEPISMGFIRARGFAEESGHFSFFLETLAPISIYYVFTQSRIKNIYKFFYCTIIVLSLIVTFSSFSYVSLLVAVLIAVYYYLTSFAKRQNTVVKILAVGGCIMLFSLLFSDVSALIIDVINTKTIGTENYEGRMNNAFTTISYLSENILWGYGPASYYRFDNSYFSLFFTILLDSGITGFACIALFLMKQFSIILKIKNKPFQCCCLISFVTATAHYIYIGNYYYPWYWFFLSMMYIFYLREKKHCEIFNYYRYQEQ